MERLETALAGRYRLRREIGRGGMAMVYRADDLKHGRPVTQKVLRPELATALSPERFLREIGVTARLDRPHIVPLLDSGEEGGHLYYVMRHVLERMYTLWARLRMRCWPGRRGRLEDTLSSIQTARLPIGRPRNRRSRLPLRMT